MLVKLYCFWITKKKKGYKEPYVHELNYASHTVCFDSLKISGSKESIACESDFTDHTVCFLHFRQWCSNASESTENTEDLNCRGPKSGFKLPLVFVNNTHDSISNFNITQIALPVEFALHWTVQLTISAQLSTLAIPAHGGLTCKAPE